MFRFITFLLGREYEECKSCVTLKEQLLFERDEKRRLTDVLLDIIKPKTYEAPPVELNQIAASSALNQVRVHIPAITKSFVGSRMNSRK